MFLLHQNDYIALITIGKDFTQTEGLFKTIFIYFAR